MEEVVGKRMTHADRIRQGAWLLLKGCALVDLPGFVVLMVDLQLHNGPTWYAVWFGFFGVAGVAFLAGITLVATVVVETQVRLSELLGTAAAAGLTSAFMDLAIAEPGATVFRYMSLLFVVFASGGAWELARRRGEWRPSRRWLLLLSCWALVPGIYGGARLFALVSWLCRGSFAEAWKHAGPSLWIVAVLPMLIVDRSARTPACVDRTDP